MKKIITASSIGLNSPYDGEDKNIDLALVDVTEKGERYGKAMVFSGAEFNEGFSNADKEIEKLFDFDLQGEEINITPTTSQQVITPSAGKNGITKATVSGVTASIDSNIVSENIVADVEILGVTGTAPFAPIAFYTNGIFRENDIPSMLQELDPLYILGLIKTFSKVGIEMGSEGVLYNPTIVEGQRYAKFYLISYDYSDMDDTVRANIDVDFFDETVKYSLIVEETNPGNYSLTVSQITD